MESTVITKLVQLFKAEKLSPESSSFEWQEDGQFLLIAVPADALADPAMGARLAARVDKIIPARPHDDSWMLVVTEGEMVVDSFCGGNLAAQSPD